MAVTHQKIYVVIKMSTSIASYCLDPGAFTRLPIETRKFYDNICLARHKVVKSHPTDPGDPTFAQNLAKLPEDILSSMLSPQGLELMGAFLGIDLAGTAAINGILRVMANGIGPEVLEAAGEKAATEGALFINNTILTAVVGAALEEGTVAAAAFAIASSVADMASEVFAVAMIVQLLGTLIDTLWDPDGYKHELGAEAMNIIQSHFDEAFANQFLEVMISGHDRFGRPIILDQVPVEYRVDADIQKSATEADNSLYQKKMYDYVYEYLSALKINSDGHAMFPRQKKGELVGPDVLQAYSNSMALALSDRNVVVASWSKTYWFFIVAGMGLVLWLLLRKD